MKTTCVFKCKIFTKTKLNLRWDTLHQVKLLSLAEHIERMRSEEFVKKVYMSESVGPNSRGRPHVRWRDRVKEYMCERGAGTRE